MSRNIKPLRIEELDWLINNYDFDIVNEYLIVKCKKLNKMTVHTTTSNFCISTKVRKITIFVETMDMWKKYFRDYNLIEIQNVINILSVQLQDITVENIEKELSIIDENLNSYVNMN